MNHYRILIFIFVCALSHLGYGQWQTVTIPDGSEPLQRHEAAFVKVNDEFILLGGRRVQPVSIYNAKTQSWRQGAEPPVEMHHFQPVVYQDKVYIAGAMTGQYPGETPLPNMYIYDPATDQWSEGPAIPADRRRGGAGAYLHKNALFLVCGIQDGHRSGHVAWLDKYDFKTGQWTKLPDAPRPRDHFQAVIAKNKIYALGGRTTKSSDNPFKNTIPEVDVFDLKKQSWSTLPDKLPTERAGTYAIYTRGEILVLGGESFSQEPAHAEVEALNIKTGKWRSLPPLVQGRHGTGVIEYEKALYVASGCGKRGGTPELKTMERLEEW